MIKLNKKSKVYIVSPYHNTGGPKSLHQLANNLIENEIDVYIVYYWNGEFTGETEMLFPFCKAKIAKFIDDDEENVLIVSESQSEVLNKYNKMIRCIWWLSLDFYLTSSLNGAVQQATTKRGLPSFMRPIMLFKFILNDPKCLKSFRKLDNKKLPLYYHMYNCEYEKEFLIRYNVPENKMAYLCGPLEKQYYKIDFETVRSNKVDVVAYNPAKMDMKFLGKVKEKLSSLNNNIRFVAIENMNRAQVYDTLKAAKVYVDFGFFPGPERMPREAVALYCNIITSTDGSAENDIDVAIPQRFKFDIRDSESVSKVVNMINNMIVNYDEYVEYGNTYREKVWNQIQSFSDTISCIFEVSDET